MSIVQQYLTAGAPDLSPDDYVLLAEDMMESATTGDPMNMATAIEGIQVAASLVHEGLKVLYFTKPCPYFEAHKPQEDLGSDETDETEDPPLTGPKRVSMLSQFLGRNVDEDRMVADHPISNEMVDEDLPEDRPAAGEGYPDNNPKTVMGLAKPGTHQIPPIAIYVMGEGMRDGEAKYGLMNWRENSVAASVYYDAIMRHLTAWWDGHNYAEDSGVHHLGHLMACAAILVDAMHGGNLIDNRPTSGPLAEYLKENTIAKTSG